MALMPVLVLLFVGVVPDNALQEATMRAGLKWLVPVGQVIDRGLAQFGGLASKPVPEIGHWFESIPKSIVTALYVGGIAVAALAIATGLAFAFRRYQRASGEEFRRSVINW